MGLRESDPDPSPASKKTLIFFNLFFVGIFIATEEKNRSATQWYGSADLDPHHNVTDPEHWFNFKLTLTVWLNEVIPGVY